MKHTIATCEMLYHMTPHDELSKKLLANTKAICNVSPPISTVSLDESDYCSFILTYIVFRSVSEGNEDDLCWYIGVRVCYMMRGIGTGGREVDIGVCSFAVAVAVAVYTGQQELRRYMGGGSKIKGGDGGEGFVTRQSRQCGYDTHTRVIF